MPLSMKAIKVTLFYLQTPCPGSSLKDYPRVDSCRFMSLEDGTIVNQSPVPKSLCSEKSLQYTQRKIAVDFADPYGKFSRYYTPIF